MKKIKCSQCSKNLIETTGTNRGFIAASVQEAGYIAKLPILYGHSEWEFFCSSECRKKWYDYNFSDETQSEARESIKEIKGKMEKGIPDLVKGLSTIQKVFNKLKEE